MARVQSIPGVFGEQFDPQALSEALGIQNFPFQAQTQAPTMVGRFVDPFPELSDVELAKEFGINPRDRTREQILAIGSRSRNLAPQAPSTIPISAVPAFGAAERLGEESIFDQLGIVDFAQRLTQPQGFGRTPEQDALIQELIGITGGATAVRGLGAPTAGALASQIAPQLTQFRQQNIANQLATLQGLTGAAGVGATERLGGISQLLDLAGLSMPQPIVEGGGGGDTGFSDFASLIGGFGSLAALCHVAEELFGKYDSRTHFARFYCATHDNWFVRIYRKMSKIWAKHLKDNPNLKPIIQPIWENMAYLGHKRYLKWQEDLHQ